MMCFVLRKRFRRNKSGNRAVPQVVVIQTYVGLHSPNIEVFRSPRWTILIGHVTQILLTTSAGRNDLAK